MRDATVRHFDAVAPGYGTSTLAAWLKSYEGRQVFKHVPASLEGKAILDAACGNGFYAKLARARGARNIVALDASSKMLAQLTDASIQSVCSSIESFTPRLTFDWIFLCGGLEFATEPELIIKKLTTLAAEGAHLILIYPPKGIASQLYRRYHQLHGISIRLFTTHELRAQLQSSGWTQRIDMQIHPYAKLGVFTKRVV